MSANREIIAYMKKFEQMQSDIDNRRREIRPEINELEREDAYLVDRFNELELMIETYQRALAGHGGDLQLGTNQEITIYLEKFKQEQFDIHYQRYEIQCKRDKLERKDDYIVDYLDELERIIDKCQRALAGEPIFIWVELQECEWKLENMRQQVSRLDLE